MNAAKLLREVYSPLAAINAEHHMNKLYLWASSFRSDFRLGYMFYAFVFACGSAVIFLVLRGFSPQTEAKRNKPRFNIFDYPSVLPDHQPPLNFWNWLKRLHPASAASMHLASILPSSQISSSHATSVPPAYPTLVEFEYRFDELARKFPQLVTKHVIGTTTKQRPLFAFRVSDNPGMNEDEPALLFTALHHAREPVGVFICHALMNELLSNYEGSAWHKRLIDSLDLWFVPLVNPDGYDYLMTSQRQFPWWRKNLRDNNNDGRFDPLIDGVDLNRNYDYNWSEGGEGEFGSWFYRGQSAFSEPETQALRDLEAQHNFIIGVSFHSYGEVVLYPWGNFHPAPDHDLILDIAQNYASRIGRQNGVGKYQVLPLNGRVGQSSVWRYATSGALDFICETGEDYFPAFESLPRLVAENVRGANYLLERALRSGISGHVREAETGAPLDAEIIVAGLERDYVKPRHANGTFGRFDRLLLPGVYTIIVRKNGYRATRIAPVSVNDSTLTYLEVELQREATRPAITSH